jgi:Uma2 family endonuclease
MLSQSNPPYYTPEEYLKLEASSEYKNEYFRGEIFQMAGGSVSHNRIIFNLSGLLYQKLNGSDCEAFNSDMRLLVETNGLYTYPDLMVTCGPLVLAPGRADTITNPLVIIEVLSTSTAEYDRTDKFELYKALETLQNYVLVDQHRAYIQCYWRVAGEPQLWTVETYRHLDESLKLPALDISLGLNEIYSRVVWPKTTNVHPIPTE